jgi:hypothetical protein
MMELLRGFRTDHRQATLGLIALRMLFRFLANHPLGGAMAERIYFTVGFRAQPVLTVGEFCLRVLDSEPTILYRRMVICLSPELAKEPEPWVLSRTRIFRKA